ncbi:MAG: ribulose phosphate epimerase [Gemmatimonas sp. SG8_17]|nr:MAG: ribulose phosphate epimerase [Gemmatimonas sp. SG8_17]
MSNVYIAPSILSADLARLAEEVAAVESGGANWIHVDVMDGHFVPNLTVGAGLVAALRRITELPIDVHLMVERPEWYIAPFADAGASVFTLHPETTAHVQRHLDQVKACGMLAGLALNPGTPLDYALEVIADLDLVLIMTVNPGFPAQKYIPSATNKILRARQLLDDHLSQARLEVDGGISRSTIGEAHRAGADTFVAGSAIFGSDNPTAEVQELRRRCFQVV